MENRIKEQQLGLFSDRTSCHGWWANQFRVLLSAAAYVLMETIRRVGLRGSELARAQVGTIRLKLLKIGTVIVRNTRRIRLFFSSAFPYQSSSNRPLRPSAPLEPLSALPRCTEVRGGKAEVCSDGTKYHRSVPVFVWKRRSGTKITPSNRGMKYPG